MPFVTNLAWAATLFVSLPLVVIFIESVLALFLAGRKTFVRGELRPSCAVLVPAHNEELGIGKTLEALLPHLDDTDRLIVIADNCTDRTAEVVRSFGVEVIERHDPSKRSKLYAVDFGIRFLEQNPPDVVIIVDADCVVSAGGIDLLAREVQRAGRPVQAAYVMENGADAGPRDLISGFAFQYKNVIRPLGLAHLGLPCLLTGTGMAFPWTVIRDAPTGHSKLADDFSLTVDLALAGATVQFCPQVEVVSELPPRGRAAYGQRKRWEQGHLMCLTSQGPRLIWGALRQRRLVLLALALELCVPPLALVFFVWMAVCCLLIIAAVMGGSPWPAVVVGSAGALSGLSILANWIKFGRKRLPYSSLLLVPLYVCLKLPMYLAMLVRPQRNWLRTERAKQ